jgi:hypothetical protein
LIRNLLIKIYNLTKSTTLNPILELFFNLEQYVGCYYYQFDWKLWKFYNYSNSIATSGVKPLEQGGYSAPPNFWNFWSKSHIKKKLGSKKIPENLAYSSQLYLINPKTIWNQKPIIYYDIGWIIFFSLY